MEGHIWANLVDYEFMGISLDYSFTSVFSESDGNQQALILEAVPSAARQEADRREDRLELHVVLRTREHKVSRSPNRSEAARARRRT